MGLQNTIDILVSRISALTKENSELHGEILKQRTVFVKENEQLRVKLTDNDHGFMKEKEALEMKNNDLLMCVKKREY